MLVVTKSEKSVVVMLSRDELTIINNALNEVCNGLSVPEFDSRMGFSVEEVERLLPTVSSAIK